MIWFTNRKTAFIIMIIMGLFMCCMSAGGIIQASRFRSDISKAYEEQRNDFNIMTASEFHSDMNVYGDVLYLYGCYCEKTTTQTKYGVEVSSHISGSYYLMPLFQESEEDPKYITVLVKNKNSTQAMEDITNDTIDAWDGKDVQWHDYFLMGKVKPLEDDVRPFLMEYLMDTEWYADEAEINKYVIPYQIEEYDPNTVSHNNKIMFAVGIGISALFFVLFLVFYKPVQRKSNYIESSMPQNNGSAPQYTPPQDINNIKQPISPDDFFDNSKKQEKPKDEAKASTIPGIMEGLEQPDEELPDESDVLRDMSDVGAMEGISTEDIYYDEYDEADSAAEPNEWDMDGIDNIEIPEDYSYDDNDNTNA